MASAVLEGLLDEGIVSVEVDLYRDAIGELTASEAAALSRAHPDRLLEYRAGRHCAREALAALGVHDVSILRSDDRSPIWPPGFVGSITHSRAQGFGWGAAAVARGTDVRALGIDGELDEPLERKLWDRVLLDPEREFVEAYPVAEQGILGKLFFSAKEATYKCQYTLTKTYLEFAEVRVTLLPDVNAFRAELVRSVPPFDAGFAFMGRYARRRGIIATAVVLR